MVRVQDLIPTARGVIHGRRTSLAIPGRLLNSPVMDAVHPNKLDVVHEVLDRYWPGDGTGFSFNHNCCL
jgi:hypothetical protein